MKEKEKRRLKVKEADGKKTEKKENEEYNTKKIKERDNTTKNFHVIAVKLYRGGLNVESDIYQIITLTYIHSAYGDKKIPEDQKSFTLLR